MVRARIPPLGAGSACVRAAGPAEERALKVFPPPGSVEGDPFWDQIRDQLLGEPSNETKACHQPKPILFSTGEVRTQPRVPWGGQGSLGWAGSTGWCLHFLSSPQTLLYSSKWKSLPLFPPGAPLAPRQMCCCTGIMARAL